MRPAQERLETGGLVRRDVELRLVMQLELVGPEGRPEIEGQLLRARAATSIAGS